MKIGTTFAPKLAIPNGITDISFYIDGLGAIEQRRFSNEDGSIHVVEFIIDDAMFHLHEVTKSIGLATPADEFGTVTIGLFVDDVFAVFDKAIAAGAKIVSPVTDYDYGYRQGDFLDPFGHRWCIQCRI